MRNPSQIVKSTTASFEPFKFHFAYLTPVRTLCENLRGLRTHFTHPTLCKTSLRIYFSPILQAPPHCESLCHLVASSQCHPVPLFWFCPLFTCPSSHLTSSSLSHSTPPFEHRPDAHFSIFIWQRPERLLLPIHRVTRRGREPSLLGCLVIHHLRRPPQPLLQLILRMSL